MTNVLLRALLPDLIKFGYIPRNDIRVNAEVQVQRRDKSPDYSAFMSGGGYMASSGPDNDTSLSNESLPGPSALQVGGNAEEDEHVLLLEFIDNARGKKHDDQ